MAAFGWLQVLALLMLAGMAGGMLVVSVGWRRFRRRLDRMAPDTRFRRLMLVAAIPIAGGVALIAVPFLPSVMDAAGLYRDHCHAHGGHHPFHLCFVHGHAPSNVWWVWSFLLPVLALLGSRVVTPVVDAWRMQAWKRRAEQIADIDDERDVCLLDSDRPIALTAGLFEPRIFVSRSLLDELDAADMETLLEHERAHCRRRDALWRFVARLLTLPLPDSVRSELLDELELAGEQICDAESGERLDVAQLLVRVERMSRANVPDLAHQFGATQLERRVRALTDPDWRETSGVVEVTASAATVTLLLVCHDWLHHSLETAFMLIF